ncbi:MAG TPA: hypothetical protein VIT43_14630 [Candidatus Dormibacteraeota bacterium]
MFGSVLVLTQVGLPFTVHGCWPPGQMHWLPPMPGFSQIAPTGQQRLCPFGVHPPRLQSEHAARLTQLQVPPWQISFGPQVWPQAPQLP